MVPFEYWHTITLHHNGSCRLLGVTPRLDVYVEEVYGEDGWLAQYAFTLDGQALAETDEAWGHNANAVPLPLPAHLKRPASGWESMALNFGGARHRGLIAEDRVLHLARPLSAQDRALLLGSGWLPDMPPSMILGLVGGYVIAEAKFGDACLVSRRLRVAYRLPQPALDEDGQPFDYDTCEVSVLHWFFANQADSPLHHTLFGLDELGLLNWPTDIIIHGGYLFVADAAYGCDDLLSCVHIWRVEDVPED